MKLIESKAEYLPQGEGMNGVYKQIELCGRTCYRSEDKITNTSAEKFVTRMIKSNHCYTGDSEVLTENGWVKWKDYQGQKVATVNSDLSFKSFEIPQRVLRQTYTGKFYEYPTLGIKVTDGHRMLGVFRLGNNDFYNNDNYDFFTCNSEFVDNNGKHKTNGERMFKTPRHCSKPLSTDPYTELVGFWLGDGCYNKETKNKIVFHLKKQRKIEYLKSLADRLGWTFTSGKGDYYRIEHEGIGDMFNKLYYSEGKKITMVPNSAKTIRSIITGLINSDGSYGVNTKTITYTSTSKSIIDWICAYAPLAGYTVSYRGIYKNDTVYKVLLLDTDYTICNDSRNKNSKVIITEETQDVYCVTISTGLIVVRGVNGITTICGNCAMLEHGTVYLYTSDDAVDDEWLDFYARNPYSKIIPYTNDVGNFWAVTTNYRVLVENQRLVDIIPYLFNPTEQHERRYTFKFTCSRAIANELIRHRTFSYAQESQRYCGYDKSKFGGELTFIMPQWYKEAKYDSTKLNEFDKFLEQTEDLYMFYRDCEMQAQEARDILPNCTKTELCMTGFSSDWRHLLDLRLFQRTGAVHPDMLDLMQKLQKVMQENNVWDNIMNQKSKFE